MGNTVASLVSCVREGCFVSEIMPPGTIPPQSCAVSEPKPSSCVPATPSPPSADWIGARGYVRCPGGVVRRVRGPVYAGCGPFIRPTFIVRSCAAHSDRKVVKLALHLAFCHLSCRAAHVAVACGSIAYPREIGHKGRLYVLTFACELM